MGERIATNFGLPWEKSYGYSQALRVPGYALDHIFISGQLSHDETGNIIGAGDFEKQARQTYQNIEALLKRLGASIQNVVQDTAFVTDIENQAAILSKIHKQFFSKAKPTSTVVEVKRLFFAEQLIEVNAMAIIHKKKKPARRVHAGRQAKRRRRR